MQCRFHKNETNVVNKATKEEFTAIICKEKFRSLSPRNVVEVVDDLGEVRKFYKEYLEEIK